MHTNLELVILRIKPSWMKESSKILGLMSGSSCDGVDAVICDFNTEDGVIRYELLHTASFKFTDKLRDDLKTVAHKSLAELQTINSAFSNFLSSHISDFLRKSVSVNYIASHGHTVLHAPDEGYTLQLGNGALISARTGIPTICDFRSQDISHGGQGAPLAPLADKILFSGHDFYLNLGGIVNISHISAHRVIGYDIGPCNQMLNALSNLRGLAYDAAGNMAATGELNQQLLEKLLANQYLDLPYPKSLDNSWVYNNYTQLLINHEDSIENRLHTSVEFIAMAIKNDLLKIAVKEKIQLDNTSIFCTGGGAFNDYMMERIRFHCNTLGVQLTIPTQDIIEYKEAMLMALMGYLRVVGKPNCLGSVTGASKDCSAGVIYYP